MFVEYINHRHLVFISLRSSENGTERNGTGNLLLTWFSCPYPVEENAFPLVYRKFALDYRLCTFKQVWTWYSWRVMFLFIPALGSSSSSCLCEIYEQFYFLLLYIVRWMQWWQKRTKPNLISLYIPTYILHFLTEAFLNFSDFCIKVFKSMHSTEI